MTLFTIRTASEMDIPALNNMVQEIDLYYRSLEIGRAHV